MTTIKNEQIGLADIAAIPDPEGRAVALALYNKLPRWIEITDDPATLPPIGVPVWTQSDHNEVEVLVRNDGTLSGQDVHYWERPMELYLGTNQQLEYVCLSHASVTITHWRPI